MNALAEQNWLAVDHAFSAQSLHYDADDAANPILQSWREKVYRHVENHLKPGSRILELNAGTGIDALHFAKNGHKVLATDIATGMVKQIHQKIEAHGIKDRLRAQQCSYLDLHQLVQNGPFDFVFSNFGGLNCLENLGGLAVPFRKLLSPGACLTLVIMPPVCPWEWMTALKGNRKALRRLSNRGTDARLEGYNFSTYYHKANTVCADLGPDFQLVACESLGLFSPPPSATWLPKHYPGIQRILFGVDNALSRFFPFNRWGDHIMMTLRYQGLSHS